ncbi:Ig-like domain-containing protein [uncultured Cellulomonas sp.]|uniref:Ig-like domain-containing protein n=1 Tax=uncultured Cellulomonas sp. TaxID=189682 RepID=UPI002632FDF2|nr:Ig-like domain-containing protein [uncultured Cellulomonas sp.]
MSVSPRPPATSGLRRVAAATVSLVLAGAGLTTLAAPASALFSTNFTQSRTPAPVGEWVHLTWNCPPDSVASDLFNLFGQTVGSRDVPSVPGGFETDYIPEVTGNGDFTIQCYDASWAVAYRFPGTLAVTEGVTESITTTDLAINPSSLLPGQPATVTATVRSDNPDAWVDAALPPVTFSFGSETATAPLRPTGDASVYEATLELDPEQLRSAGGYVGATFPGVARRLSASDASEWFDLTKAPSVLELTVPATTVTGQPASAVATVTRPAGVADWLPTPTGTVTFDVEPWTPGPHTVVPVAVGPDGRAVLDLSGYAADKYSVSVTYSGDANHEPVEEYLTDTVVVTAYDTTTTLEFLDGPTPLLGAPTTAVATVARTDDRSPVTSGAVHFTSGVYAGTVPVGPDGSARWDVPTPVAGAFPVRAEYLGADVWARSQRDGVVEVRQGTPTVTVEGRTAWTYGEPAEALAAVAGVANAAAPLGSLEYRIDGQWTGYVGTDPWSSVPTGTGRIDLSHLTPGRHEVTVGFIGDANYVAADSDPLVVEVAKATPSVELGTLDGRTTWALGEPAALHTMAFGVTPTAVPPTGAVLLTVDDGEQLTGTDLADLQPGTHTITARYPGDAVYTPAERQLTVTVTPAVTDTVVEGNPWIVAGDAATLRARVTPRVGQGVPTGSVTFTVDGVTGAPVPLEDGSAALDVSGLLPGQHDVDATYSGSDRYAGSAWERYGVSVSAVETRTSVQIKPTWVTGLGSASTATVTVTRADSDAPVTTGKVEVIVDAPSGSPFFASRTVTTSAVGTDGTLSVQLPTHRVGDVTVTAEYLGSPIHAASLGSAGSYVAPGDAGLKLSGETSWTYGAPGTLSATADGVAGADRPTGTVSLVIDGLGQGPVVELGTDGATTTLGNLAPGTYTVTAFYSGDATYSSVATDPFQVTVHRAPAAVSTALDGPATWAYGRPSTVSATVTGVDAPDAARPGPAVLSADGGAVVGPDGSMDWAPGIYIVTATYPGDPYYLPGTATRTVEVTRSATSLALDVPASWTWGQPAAVTATVTRASGAAAPTGTATFVVDGVVREPVVVSADGVATLDLGELLPGDHAVTATYSGDARYAGSAAGDHPVAVDAVATTSTIDVAAGLALGASADATVTVVRADNGAPVTEGTVEVSIGSSTSTLGVRPDGTVSVPVPTGTAREIAVSARYLGSPRFAGSEAYGTTRVATGSAGVTVDGPTTWTYGSPAAFVAATPGVEGADAPTGGVRILVEGADHAVAPFDAVAGQPVDLSLLAPGEYAVTASYAGDGSYLPGASAPVLVTVAKAPVQLDLAVADAAPSYGSATAVTARVLGVPHPGAATPGAATVTTDGGTVTDGVIRGWAPGTHTVTATFPGDAYYLPAERSLTVAVTAAATALTVRDAATTVGTPAALEVDLAGGTAPAPAAADVTVWAGDTQVGLGRLDAGHGTVQLDRALAAGEHTLTVRYAGDGRYAPSETTLRLTVAGIPAHPEVVTGGPVAVGVSDASLNPSSSVTITAEGFQPGETVVFVLHSDPVILGTAVAGEDGRAVLTVASLPAGTALGDHLVQAIGGTSQRVAEIPVTVGVPTDVPGPVAPPTTADPAPEPSAPVTEPVASAAAPRATSSALVPGTRLASTGSTAGPLVGLSALLVLTGAAALVLSRRRADGRA